MVVPRYVAVDPTPCAERANHCRMQNQFRLAADVRVSRVSRWSSTGAFTSTKEIAATRQASRTSRIIGIGEQVLGKPQWDLRIPRGQSNAAG